MLPEHKRAHTTFPSPHSITHPGHGTQTLEDISRAYLSLVRDAAFLETSLPRTRTYSTLCWPSHLGENDDDDDKDVVECTCTYVVHTQERFSPFLYVVPPPVRPFVRLWNACSNNSCSRRCRNQYYAAHTLTHTHAWMRMRPSHTSTRRRLRRRRTASITYNKEQGAFDDPGK